jgi:dTDP-4-amino-4,6-dideoxygalactose transaminase
MHRMADPVALYETTFARHVAAEHAIAFGFARHALVAALTAAGLRPGDEVMLSPLTCKVVPLALLSMQLKPVYADISAATMNLDPRKAADRLTPATRAILFQHTYGHTGGIEEITGLARQRDLLLVEDCAQCMPVVNESYRPGRHGNVAIFSNNAGKPLSAGSGGVAVTDSASMADGLRDVRGQMARKNLAGNLQDSVNTWLHQYLLRPSLYWLLFDLHRRMDSNYAQRSLETEISDEITRTALQPSARQARRGLWALRNMAAMVRHRADCCADYRAALPPGVSAGAAFSSTQAPLFYYPALVTDKAALLQRARKAHIEIIPWPRSTPIYPVEDMAALAMYGYAAGDCPIAESIATQLVGLPTHDKVTRAVRSRIITLLGSQARES